MRIKLIISILAAGLLMTGTLSGQVFNLPPAIPLGAQNPLDKEGRRLQRRASQMEMRGEYEKALNDYLELYSRYPDYNPFYDGAIRCFFAAGKLAKGLDWVDSLKTNLLKDAQPVDLTAMEKERLGSLIVDEGRFIGKQGDRDAALQCWEAIYRIPHLSSAPYYRLFNAMLDIRYPDGLFEMVKKARRATGDPTLMAPALARFQADRGQIEGAIDEWLLLMRYQPRQTESIKRSILGLPEDETTRARIASSLKAALSQKTIQLPVTELLAAFYFRNREWKKAYEYVKAADHLSGDSGSTMLSFAENLTHEQEFNLALQILDDLEKSHSELAESPRGILCRAQAWAGKGSYQAADSAYGLLTTGKTLVTNEGQEALLLHARLRMDKLRQPEAARRILETALKRFPRLHKRSEAILLIGDTYLAERNLDQARQTYLQAAETRFGRQPDVQSKALINAAQVDFYAGLIEPAIQKLNDATQQDPDGLLTNDALDLLELLRDDKTDSIHLRLYAAAELEKRLKSYVTAESLYTIVSQKAKVSDLAERALLQIVQLQRITGHTKEAAATLENVLQRFSKSLRAPENLLTLGDLYRLELNNTDQAKAIYEKILIDYPQSLQADEARRRLRKMEQPET